MIHEISLTGLLREKTPYIVDYPVPCHRRYESRYGSKPSVSGQFTVDVRSQFAPLDSTERSLSKRNTEKEAGMDHTHGQPWL